MDITVKDDPIYIFPRIPQVFSASLIIHINKYESYLEETDVQLLLDRQKSNSTYSINITLAILHPSTITTLEDH